jgi:hypothetical protein
VTKKAARISRTDLIDLLLDSDECTRKLLIFQALQSGALKKSEAEEVVAQMLGLERAADPQWVSARLKAPSSPRTGDLLGFRAARSPV